MGGCDAGVPVGSATCLVTHRFARKAAGESSRSRGGRSDRGERPGRRAAGYDDPERWWEDVVEHVPGPAVVRRAGARRLPSCEPTPRTSIHEDAVREAHMRHGCCAGRPGKASSRIAVVCGAWHVPALTADAVSGLRRRRLLRGLPKAKAAHDLGAVDLRAAVLRPGYGARHPIPPAGTTTCSSSPGQPIGAGWSGPPPSCARQRPGGHRRT